MIAQKRFSFAVTILFATVVLLNLSLVELKIFSEPSLYSTSFLGALKETPAAVQKVLAAVLAIGSFFLACKIFERHVSPNLASAMAALALGVYHDFPLRDFISAGSPESFEGLNLTAWPRPSISTFVFLLVILLVQRSIAISFIGGLVVTSASVAIWFVSPTEAILATAYTLITIASRAFRARGEAKKVIQSSATIVLGTLALGTLSVRTASDYDPGTGDILSYEILVGAIAPAFAFLLVLLFSRQDALRIIWEARGPLTLIMLELTVVLLSASGLLQVSVSDFLQSTPVSFLHIYMWSIVIGQVLELTSRSMALSSRNIAGRSKEAFFERTSWMLTLPLTALVVLYLVLPIRWVF